MFCPQYTELIATEQLRTYPPHLRAAATVPWENYFPANIAVQSVVLATCLVIRYCLNNISSHNHKVHGSKRENLIIA